MKSLIFIINGAKKQNKKLTEIFNCFTNSTLFSKVELVFTQYPGHATSIAIKSASEFDYLIVVGGDGTLNEVINGIDLNSQIIIGLLPFGTGNDFAKGQKLQLDAHALLKLISTNSFKNIDLGLIESLDVEAPLKRRFINIADIGLGGFVTQHILKNNNKFLSGKLKYTQAILKGMIQFSKPKIKIQGDYDFQGKILTLAICNGQYFGYGLKIAPLANVLDDALNITRIGNVSMMDYFKNLGKLKRGELIKHPEVDYKTIQRISVHHLDQPCPIEVDGEFIGYTPVNIQLLPTKLKFLLP